MAGEVEREAEERRRDRKRSEHTSACGRAHTKQWVKTITEGHYQMRFVKLPGIQPPTPTPPPSPPCSRPLLPAFFFALFLHSNDKSWWVVPAWDGKRHAILLAINFRL